LDADLPGGWVVYFSGAASGIAITDSNGDYSVTLTADSLGEIDAITMDSSFIQVARTSATLASEAPEIEDFCYSAQPDGWYKFTGRVIDESPAWLTVRFGGGPSSLSDQTTTVAADGSFEFWIQLNGTASDEGTATAQVTDWWGLESELALCDVHQTGVG